MIGERRAMASLGVLLFHTTSAVLRSEKLLKQRGLAVKLVPTPREFSSDCGIAIRFEWERGEEALRAIEEAGIECSGCRELSM